MWHFKSLVIIVLNLIFARKLVCVITPLDLDNPSVKREATFAIEELQTMSDSGAYSSLKLKRCVCMSRLYSLYNIMNPTFQGNSSCDCYFL